MKRFLPLAVVLICGYHFSMGQSCPQILRLARSTYEQGRLHELPPLLEKCLASNGFTQAEKVDAYRLLTLAYIYLEEPDKADEYMLKVIQTDNYFKPTLVEPAEFIALYKTFRTTPIFRVGGRVGALATQPNVSNSQFASPGVAAYDRAFSFVFGATFEIPWKKRLTLNPELLYSMHSFDFTNTNQVAAGNNTTDVSISMNYLSVPLIVQYTLMPATKETMLNPYVSAGVSPEYLFSANVTPGKKQAGNQPVETKTYAALSEFEKFNVSVLAAAGIKYRFAGGFVTAELRYKYGLMNVNKPSNSLNVSEIAWNYHHMDGIFKLNALQLTVGYVHNVFNPKKLTVKK